MDLKKQPHEEEEEEVAEPVSPTGQYFNSSVLSVSVLSVLESQIPIDDSQTISLLNNVFLPINPRFSSIMVRDKNGVKQWRKVEVNLKDHINVPVFSPEKSSPEGFYDEQFNDYLSKISMDQLPQSRPLWGIHIIKYPTRNAAGSLVFKLHHALGDGFSLMGALLSCLQRADDPSLPITFPILKTSLSSDEEGILKAVPRVFMGLVNTVKDFGFGLMKSTVVEDGRTPLRSGDDRVVFRPIDITTITFSLDQIKQIKTKLQVTINDVVTGIIFLGTRLYMQEARDKDFSKISSTTALVLLNTRNIAGYKSVEEMIKPNNDTKWGNQFGFLHVSIPVLNGSETLDPTACINKARELIQRKRNSGAVFLTGKLLETLRQYRGPEVAAGYIHSTLKNSTMTISNIIGPVEQLALSNHPCAGMYFMVVGVPQSLTITMISYMGNLRVAIGTERGYVDSNKFKSCIQEAFDSMFKVTGK